MPHSSGDCEHTVTTNTWKEEATTCQNATTVRCPLPWGRIYHFNVVYNHAKTSLSRTADTELAQSITGWLVERLGVKGLVNSYYHDRDNRPQNSLATELDRVLNGSALTILVLTQGFLKNCWPQYTHLKPFRHLLKEPKSRHRLLVISVGVSLGELPPDLRQHEVVELQERWRNDMVTWARIDRSVDEMLQNEMSGADCLTTSPSDSIASKKSTYVLSPFDHKMEEKFLENNDILQDMSSVLESSSGHFNSGPSSIDISKYKTHATFSNELLQTDFSSEIGANSSMRNPCDHNGIAETLWDNVVEPVKSKLERKVEYPYLVLSNEYLDYLLECERDFNTPARQCMYDLEKENILSHVISNEAVKAQTKVVYEDERETEETATETWQNMLNLHAQGACNCFRTGSENSRYRPRLTLPSFRSHRKTMLQKSRVPSSRLKRSDRIRRGVRIFSEFSSVSRPVLREREISSLQRSSNYLVKRRPRDSQIQRTRRYRSHDSTYCYRRRTYEDSFALSYQNCLSSEEEFDRNFYSSHLSFAERERARIDLLNHPNETLFLKTEDNNTSDAYDFHANLRTEIRDSQNDVCETTYPWQNCAQGSFGIETGMRYAHENDDRFDHLDHESRIDWSENIDFLDNPYRNAINNTISAQIARERAASPETFDFPLRSDFCCAERELEKLQAKEEENCLRLSGVSPEISTFTEFTTDNMPETMRTPEHLEPSERTRDKSQQIISNLRERVWKAATQTPVKVKRGNSANAPLSVIEPLRNCELVSTRDFIPFDANTNTHEYVQTDSYELYTDKEEYSQPHPELTSCSDQISSNIFQDMKQHLANNSTAKCEEAEPNPEATSSENVEDHEVEANVFHQENILAALLATELLKMEQRETVEKIAQKSKGDISRDNKELSSKGAVSDTSKKRVTFREERNQAEMKPMSTVQVVSQNKPRPSVDENEQNISKETLERDRDNQPLGISNDTDNVQTLDQKVTKFTKVCNEKQSINKSNGSSRKRKVSTESRLRGMNIVSLGMAKEILQSQIKQHERSLSLETVHEKNSSQKSFQNRSCLQHKPKTAPANEVAYGENIVTEKLFNASIDNDNNNEHSTADKNEDEAKKPETNSVTTFRNDVAGEEKVFKSSESSMIAVTVHHLQSKEYYATQQSDIIREDAFDREIPERTGSEENVDKTPNAVTFYSQSPCKDSLINAEESRVGHSIIDRTKTQEIRNVCVEQMTVKEEYAPYYEETAYVIFQENPEKNIVASNVSNEILAKSSVNTRGTGKNKASHEQTVVTSISVMPIEKHSVNENRDAVKTESLPNTDNTDHVSLKQTGDSSSDEEVVCKTDTFIIYNSGTCEKVDAVLPHHEQTEKNKSALIFQQDTLKSNRNFDCVDNSIESVNSESGLNVVAKDISEVIIANEISKLSSEQYVKEDVHAIEFSEVFGTHQGEKEATYQPDTEELGIEHPVVAETAVAFKTEDGPLMMQATTRTENTELSTNAGEIYSQSVRHDSVHGVKTEEVCQTFSKTNEHNSQEKDGSTGNELVEDEIRNDNATSSVVSSEIYTRGKNHHVVKTESQELTDKKDKQGDSSSDEEVTCSIERYIIYNSGTCEKVDSVSTLSPKSSQIETEPPRKDDCKNPRYDTKDFDDSVETVRSGLNLNVVSQNISDEILALGQPETLTEYLLGSQNGIAETNFSRVVTKDNKESTKTWSNNGRTSENKVIEENAFGEPTASSYSENLVAASLAYDISRQYIPFETNKNGTLFLQMPTNYPAANAMTSETSKDESLPGNSHKKESLEGENSVVELAQGIKPEIQQIVDPSQKSGALGIKKNIVASTICEKIQFSQQSKTEVKNLEQRPESQHSRKSDDTTNEYERRSETNNVIYSVSVTVPKQQKENEQSLCQSSNNPRNLCTEIATRNSVTADKERKLEQEYVDVSEQCFKDRENQNIQKAQEIIELQEALRNDSQVLSDAEEKWMEASRSANQVQETSDQSTELLATYETTRFTYRRDENMETDGGSCVSAERNTGRRSRSEMASPEMESVISFTERGKTNVKLQSRAEPEIMASTAISDVVLASGNEGNDEVVEGPCGERKRQPENEEDENEGDWLVPVYRGMCHVMSKPEMPYLG